MVKQVVVFFSLLFTSCNCIIPLNEKSVEKKIISSCPSEGKCSTNLIDNKSLEIKTDPTGAIYYELIDNLKSSVIKYEYDEARDTTLQDNAYKEEVLIEIPNEFKEINSKKSELNSVKMIFGKHCFCREQAGIYIIKNGKINSKNKNNNTFLTIEFSIPNIDHKINKITLYLKTKKH